jgi:hypothetical protein
MHELVGKTLGNYNILERVGRGGTASVFKALDLETGETVAVKVLMPQLTIEEDFKERFKREAQVLHGLRHPNIVPVLDYGQSNGLVYLVMPFMKVGSLRDRMTSGEFRVGEGARIMHQIAKALQFAHEAGVIHRDVKPSNILIDEDGNAWLSDFGFAYVSDSSLDLTGSGVIGTPSYISPELVNGESITAFSDQYSLAVVLYQMSTGLLPFDAETPLAIAIKHVMEPLPRPRVVNPNLPDAVETVLIKALSKDPTHRFNSIAEFNDAFQAALYEAVDASTGLLKPGAVGQVPVPLAVETYQVEEVEKGNGAWFQKRTVIALLLLLLLACPMTVFGIYRLGPGVAAAGESETHVAQINATNEIKATANVVSTAIAPQEGTVVAPWEIETAVAATLTAMAPDDLATPTPLPSDNWYETPPTSTHTQDPLRTYTWTPVPSATSIFDPTQTRTSTPSGPTNTPTKTPFGFKTPTPTLTFVSSKTVPASFIDTPTRTVTPTFAGSGTPTLTKTSTFAPSSPTRTRTPTISRTPSPTRTRTRTPTITQTPTVTLTFTRTTTPSQTLTPTVTFTPTQDPCELIEFIPDYSFPDDKAKWKVYNNTASDIYIMGIYINWHPDHTELEQVKLNAAKIWQDGDTSPPTTMTWSVTHKDRKIKADDDKKLEFHFKDKAPSPPSALQVTFDNGCVISP